ncbi:LuxR family transcriptional regulator [Mycobacterium kyorinense]|uniref:LuxR family transcriptional regulator n=1 Tax=Mycobacterium kyorinense TaxID=487514 RepID=A0A1A2ZNQ7_9MYCO|nr:AAA family ATPase [Mycobacterium kyorinense]OBI51935.1 LuxR family transcriptional regulator [Mycobacterium kyorinense]
MVGRDDEVRRALAALDADVAHHGVVLVGDTGVGKSTLARAIAETVRSRGRPVRFAFGTETASAVPFGAFFWLTPLDTASEPAVMLATAKSRLEQEENLVLVVDDAQLLDPWSASLVYHLAASGSVRMIVTIRSGDVVSDTVTALWKDGLLLRLHLKAFTRQQSEELIRTVLGGAVEPRLAKELHGQTAGNPLMLRGLLNSSKESGALVCTEHGWHLRGALHPDRELNDLLESRLRSMTAGELEVVEVVATAGVLNWEILREVCDSDTVARLERLGVLELVTDESHTVAHLTHPVLGESAIQRAGVVRRRQLNGMLAEHLRKQMHIREQQTNTPDVRTRIQLAQFMMRSDLAPDLELIIEAAASAVSMSNIACAEELAKFAFDHGGGVAAAIVLAQAMSWKGLGDAAETVLSDADPDGADEWLIAQWTCLRAANLFFDCGRVAQARQLLAGVRDRADTQAADDLVTAMEGVFACFSGDFQPAIALGLSLGGSDVQPLTARLVATGTSWVSALTGRPCQSHRITEVVQAAVPDQQGPHQYVMALAEVVAATGEGKYVAAERVWERHAPAATVGPEADAFVHAMLGLVQLARGALPAACTAFQASRLAMAQGFPPGWLMLLSAWRVQAEGARGNSEAAAAALRSSEEAYGPQVAVFLPELELARAWQQASVGETTAAQMHSVRAAQIAQASGMNAIEMRALHTAIRFGDRSCAERMAELGKALNTPLAEAVAMHARGVAEHDGGLLDDAADRFAGIGAVALAADAAAQAAGEHARNACRGKEVESSIRAYRLAKQGDIRTPAVAAGARPLPITDRENEITMLVAAGLSNRQIADRLCVSVRTAEGHLYRIFAKLGISRRDQLIHLLNVDRPSA